MWSMIQRGDTAGLARYVEIMQAMDGRYEELETAHLVRAIDRHQAEIWHYDGGDFELVMRFEYQHRRGHYQLVSVGMAGIITPQAALDLCVDRVASFLTSHSEQYLWAARPKQMDNSDIQSLHDLAADHSGLDVTVVRESDQMVIWRLEYVGVAVGG